MSREKYGTVQRVLWIMKELARHGQFHTREYMERFEVTVRTMSEDLRYFREWLSEWFENRTGEVDPAAQLISKDSSTYRLKFKEYFFFGFGDSDLKNFYPFIRSLQKTPSLLPFPLKELMKEMEENAVGPESADLADRIVYKTFVHDTIAKGLLEVIMDGIVECRKISFHYTKGSGDVSQRIIEPLMIVNYGGMWYLLGDQGRGKAPNLFKISRISQPSLTDQKFKKKKSRDLAQKEFLDAFGIYLGGNFKEGKRRVTVRFWGAETASLIQGRQYHDSQSFTMGKTPTGQVYGDLSVLVWHYDEILSEALRWGADAEALEPEDFRQAWIDKVRALSQRAGIQS